MQILLSTRIESVPASKLKRMLGHDFRFNKTNNVSKDGENKAYIFNEENTPATALNDSSDMINLTLGTYDENIKANPLKSLQERLGARGGLNFTFKPDEFLRNPNIHYFNKNIKDTKLANDTRDLLLKEFDFSIDKINTHIRSQTIESTGYKRSLGNLNHFQMGVLTFGVDEATKQQRGTQYKDSDGLTPDEANYINSLDKNEMDKAMLDYMDKFEKTYNVKIKYITRHDDEKVVHFHFIFENYNYEMGKSFKTLYAPSKLKLIQLGSDLQDLAGNAFTPLNINRGAKKYLTNARHKSISKMHEAQLQEQQQIINSNNTLIHELDNTIEILATTGNDLNNKVINLKKDFTQFNLLKKEYIQLQSNYSSDSIKYNELSIKIKQYQKLDQDTRKEHKSAKAELSNITQQIKKIKTEVDSTQSFKDETHQLIKDYVLENTQKGMNGFMIHDVQEFVSDISDAINDAADLELISKTESQLKQQVSTLSKYKDLYTQSNAKEVLENITQLQISNQTIQTKLKKAMDLIKQARYHKRLKSGEIDKLKVFLKDKDLLSNYLDMDLLHTDIKEL